MVGLYFLLATQLENIHIRKFLKYTHDFFDGYLKNSSSRRKLECWYQTFFGEMAPDLPISNEALPASVGITQEYGNGWRVERELFQTIRRRWWLHEREVTVVTNLKKMSKCQNDQYSSVWIKLYYRCCGKKIAQILVIFGLYYFNIIIRYNILIL